MAYYIDRDTTLVTPNGRMVALMQGQHVIGWLRPHVAATVEDALEAAAEQATIARAIGVAARQQAFPTMAGDAE